MQNINRVVIAGNLTRDPELRSTQSGMQVLGFGVAVNDSRKNPQTGEWEDRPNYVDCVLFGTRAQSLSQIMAKGMKVCVEGKLRYSSWEANDGSKRSKLEVVADNVELPPRASQQSAPQAGYAPQQAPQAAPSGGYAQQPRAAAQQAPQAAYAPQQYAQQPALYGEDIPF